MQLIIDESFAEKVIPGDDSVRLLDRVIEEIDIRSLVGESGFEPLKD